MISFIEKYAKLIVNYPDTLRVVENRVSDTFIEVIIHADASDVGKLIGKNGNMINAIKTIANGCKAKNGISYKIQVVAVDS